MDLEHAVATPDGRRDRAGVVQPTGQASGEPVPLRLDDTGGVDAAVHGAGDRPRCRWAGDPPGKRQRVDAEVEQRTAALLQRAEAMVGIVGDGDREVDVHSLDRSDFARMDPTHRVDRGRAEPHPHRFHREPVVRPSGVEDAIGVGRRQGERLLDQHVLAGLEHGDRVVHVTGLEGGDVDDIDVGIGGEIGVVSLPPGESVDSRPRAVRRTPFEAGDQLGGGGGTAARLLRQAVQHDRLEFPIDDPAELAKAVSTIVADPELGARYAAAGRQRYEAEFTEDAVVRRYLDFFSQVVH